MSRMNHRRKNPKPRDPAAYALAVGRNGGGFHHDRRLRLLEAAAAEELALELEELEEELDG